MRKWPRTDVVSLLRGALVLGLVVHGRAWGAFAVAPGEEDRVLKGYAPSYRAVIERAFKLKREMEPDPRPRTELSALLISRSRPIEEGDAAGPPPPRPVRRDDDAGADDPNGHWRLLFLTAGLVALSVAAYFHFRHRLREET